MTEDSRQSFDFKVAQYVSPYGEKTYSFTIPPPSHLELTVKAFEGRVVVQTPPNWNIGEKEFTSWEDLNKFVLELKFAGIKSFGVEELYSNSPHNKNK